MTFALESWSRMHCIHPNAHILMGWCPQLNLWSSVLTAFDLSTLKDISYQTWTWTFQQDSPACDWHFENTSLKQGPKYRVYFYFCSASCCHQVRQETTTVCVCVVFLKHFLWGWGCVRGESSFVSQTHKQLIERAVILHTCHPLLDYCQNNLLLSTNRIGFFFFKKKQRTVYRHLTLYVFMRILLALFLSFRILPKYKQDCFSTHETCVETETFIASSHHKHPRGGITKRMK